MSLGSDSDKAPSIKWCSRNAFSKFHICFISLLILSAILSISLSIWRNFSWIFSSFDVDFLLAGFFGATFCSRENLPGNRLWLEDEVFPDPGRDFGSAPPFGCWNRSRCTWASSNARLRTNNRISSSARPTRFESLMSQFAVTFTRWVIDRRLPRYVGM